jgi:hypothetical protein
MYSEKIVFHRFSLGISTQNRRDSIASPFPSLRAHLFGRRLLWGWFKTIDFEE